jgi:hypothetical protein
MTTRFQGHFENGVIVPDEKVELPERTTFTVSIDAPAADDPRPAGGVALIDWRARHRLKVTADAAAINTDPEFDIENS